MSSYNLIYAFTELFTIYIFEYYYATFFSIEKKKISFAIAAYVAYFLAMMGLHYVNIPSLNLVCSIFIQFCITSCYASPIRSKILAVSELTISMFAIELLVSVATKSAYIEPFQHYEYQDEVGLFLSRMLMLSYVLLRRCFHHRKAQCDLPIWIYTISPIVPLLTIVIEIYMISINCIEKRTVIVSIILLFIINLVVFLLYDLLTISYEKVIQSKMLTEENRYYQNQCDLMKESLDQTRSFRHDIANHFTVLESLLEQKEDAQALAYLSDLKQKEIDVLKLYANTGNLVVDSIINYKLSCSEFQNAEIHVDLLVPTTLPVETMDLATILTNLLDNARNALQKIENNRKFFLRMHYEKGILLMQIRNTYNGNVQYENGELVSTKNDGKAHGFGMKNVQAAIEKYDGLCRYHHDSLVFQTDVLLYMKPVNGK